MKRHWRRFRAAVRPVQYRATGDLLRRARAQLENVLADTYGRRRLYVEHLDIVIEEQAKRATLNPDASEWFALLILRTPVAVRAQRHMDKHPHGSTDQRRYLFQLIDFNDTFVSTVLMLQPYERRGFIDRLQIEMARFCKRVGSPMFTDEQFEAITRGLTREIAVYLGAIDQGFQASMTSRAKDAMGVDLVITDPVTRRSLNLDCKTPSSYRYRVQDLAREGRLSEAEAQRADELGYAFETNGHGDEAIQVVLFRVDPNETGDIRDFVFTEPRLLGRRLRALFLADYI